LEREWKGKKKGHEAYEKENMKTNAEEIKIYIYSLKVNNKIRNYVRKARTK
jgi:hypothetical protein